MPISDTPQVAGNKALWQRIDDLNARIRELEAAAELWRKERGGIGMACFGRSIDQDMAFAKADRDFAFAVDKLTRAALDTQTGRGQLAPLPDTAPTATVNRR
jgi:hypothetical protein